MARIVRRPSTRFSSWIRSHTVAGVLRDLHGARMPATRQSVYQWLDGRTSPRLEVAVRLVEVSRGAITTADIVEHRELLRCSGE